MVLTPAFHAYPDPARVQGLFLPLWEEPKGVMRIIAKWSLVQFWESGHGDAEQPLKAWHALAKAASWRHPKAIKAEFSSASFLENHRVLFNIAGNKYRLLVKVDYEFDAIYIRFIGTHADYDKIQASSI
jgi:mRNA interferase HigB